MYNVIQKPTPHKCATLIRYINMGTGALIAAFGLVGVLFLALMNLLSGKIFLVFSPIFQIIVGIGLIVMQLKPEIIKQNFHFMSFMLGRALFNFYIASWSYFNFSCGGNNEMLAWVSASMMFGIGVVYLILHFAKGNSYSNSLREELQQYQITQ